MYITLWSNFRGHPENVSFMQFFSENLWFQTKDSQGFYNSYNSINKTNSRNVHFHHLPKLYVGFK